MGLMDYLPEDYKKSPPTVEIQVALERMTNGAEEDISDLREQFFLSTATWGLSLWEWLYDVDTDLTKDMEQRRSVVAAKIRGKGTTTVEMIKNVSEAYVNGLVDVVEYNSEYRFEIVMMSTIGIPPNMEDLKATIEEIKPAHLDYTIIIKYNTWGMLKDARLTWDEVAQRTWTEVKEVAF